MKKKWQSVTDWQEMDHTKTEVRFEKLLTKNGYHIDGVRWYSSKTDYLISKGNLVKEYSVYRADNSAKRGDMCFEYFEKAFDLHKRFIEA